MKEEVIENLLDGITALNYRQWEMLKTSVDIAFKAKVKDTRVHFSEEVRNLIHEDLTEDE